MSKCKMVLLKQKEIDYLLGLVHEHKRNGEGFLGDTAAFKVRQDCVINKLKVASKNKDH